MGCMPTHEGARCDHRVQEKVGIGPTQRLVDGGNHRTAPGRSPVSPGASEKRGIIRLAGYSSSGSSNWLS